jgi:hypothetical protein
MYLDFLTLNINMEEWLVLMGWRQFCALSPPSHSEGFTGLTKWKD